MPEPKGPGASAPATTTDRLRQVAVVAAVVGGLVSGATGDYGSGDDSSSRLVPAGWAFGIWGPLYAGSLTYAVYQARPALAADPELRRIGWPAAAAYLGAGLWVRAAGDPRLYLPLVAVTTVTASLAHGRLDRDRSGGRARQWLVRRPVGGFAGWLTLATAVSSPEQVARLLGADVDTTERRAALPLLVATGAVVAARSVRRPGSGGYPLAVAWGLIGTAVQQRIAAPPVALAAAAGAAGAAVLAVVSDPARARRLRGRLAALARPVAGRAARGRPGEADDAR